MKIKINSNDLLNQIEYCNHAVSTKNYNTILSNLAIRTDNNYLEIFSTDMEIYIKSKLQCEIIEEGSLTVNASKLLSILKVYKGNEIVITKEDNIILFKSTDKSIKTTFKLLTLPYEDYPKFNDLEKSYIDFNLSCKDLKYYLEVLHYTVSHEAHRPQLNGISIISDTNSILFDSTDGKRGTRIKLNKKLDKFNVIIPNKTLALLGKVSSNYDNDIKIYIGETNIKFEIGDITIISALIQSNFPNFDNIIPADNTNVCELNKEVILSSLKRLTPIVGKEFIRIELKFNKNKLNLVANNPDYGNSEDMIGVKFDKNLTIYVNIFYLIDMISQCQEDNITLYINDDIKPMIIYEDNKILMLMKMKGAE